MSDLFDGIPDPTEHLIDTVAGDIYVIEFRSGSYFQDLEAKNGGPLATAQRFSSKEEVSAFMDEHQWILFNGGMALSLRDASRNSSR